MRISRITAENFLSFDHFEWSNLDSFLNVVVGPNGAGKTNLLRTLRAIVDTLGYDGRSSWQRATRCNTASDSFRLSLDLELAGKWEQEFLVGFLSAALCDQDGFQRLRDQKIPQRDIEAIADLERFAQLVRSTLRPESVAWLFRGRLTVEYEPEDNWRLWYESLPGEPPFRWNLNGFNSRGLSVTEEAGGGLSFLGAVLAGLPDDDWTALVDYFQGGTDFLPRLDIHRALEQAAQRVIVEVHRPSGVLLPAHREFERLAGIRLETSHYYDGRFAFEQIARRLFVFTENVRKMPTFRFQSSDLRNLTPLDLSDGQNLALFLFQHKNGSQSQRERYEKIRAMFQRLTERDIDVGLSAQTEASENSAKINDQVVELDLRVITQACEIPLEFSGAGFTEALFLSAIIEGIDGHVILLDEPALNLHPTTQATVLREIEALPQNQFLVITHSSVMVPVDEISKVSRLILTKDGTARSSLDLTKLDPKQLAKVEKELRASVNVVSLLFNCAVILVEGETELGALPVWYEKQFGEPLERSNVAIHWVGGDTNFETYLRFLHGFAVPWVIVCDGKVLCYTTPGRLKNIAVQMENAGIAKLERFDQLGFLQRCSVLAEQGVFTVAKAWEDEFEALPVVQQNKCEAEREVGSSKARQGHYLAERYPCPAEVVGLLEHIRSYFGLKKLDKT